IVGGEVNEIGSGAVWGTGDWLVVEADESDGTFLDLHAEIAVVTSVEPDHLEHYGGWEPLVAAFGRFLDGAAVAIVCADDPVAARLGAEHGAITYGVSEGATYRMVDIERGRSHVRFSVDRDGALLGTIDLPVRGLHNARNACAALAA